MKPKVFISAPIPKEVENYIAQHCDYRIWDKKEPIPPEILAEEVADVEGLMTKKGAINKEFLEKAPQLKVVSTISVGYDSFDIEAMKERSVLGTHTPFVLDETVADLVFGLILSAARRLPELDRWVKEGNWGKEKSSERNFGVDVHHTTLGIIGMGRIGEKIARRAALGFEMNVLYNSNSRKQEAEEKYGARYSEVDDLLAASDFVVVMLPLTPETHHIIGQKQFDLMKPDAIFINCARGQVVDEKALVQALQEKKIRGAGLDVFEVEPVESDNPLLQLDNVVTLPHIGSATHNTRFDMAMKAAENLVAGVTGQVPPDVVKELRSLTEQ
ncbi:D-glycerate dehydrogenase [Planomicrobium sp. CPCC 101079]|uniref:2-hydroxyacid dehydrogenase n=1 Tax=Planomicrobium sp. CPCC 101079 TaxID=2599618 RepID=UPI0011B6A3BB|nr:D-glycerate dehydrogenase [Planomicrobium sp. CPCC 101079]TWT01761.1 D-glycerate dehydrogenase [Planomicrobium sp. CPCC 101079]